MQPQAIRVKKGKEADEYLALTGHWIVANVQQQIGWPDKSVLIEFRGQKLALLPEEDQRYPAVALLKPQGVTDDEARTLIQHFLSSLAWAEGGAIKIEGWSGGGRPSRAGRSNFGQLRRPNFQINYLPDPQDNRARLALAFYREGLGLEHDAYAFLSFYKIINLVHRKGDDQIAWIANHLGQVWGHEAIKRIISLSSAGENIADYLYTSGRCAVAHAGAVPTVDPENLGDARRLHFDLPLIKNLAEIAIEEEFHIQTPHTVWSEHKYELGGFEVLLGAPFVGIMKNGGSDFEHLIPELPNIGIRLREHPGYSSLAEMKPIIIRAVQGLVTLQCTSKSGRVSIILGLDFPSERLRFDPVDGVIIKDDGTADAAEEVAELHLFFADYFRNGELEIWSGPDCLVSRCDPFVPTNIDLGATIKYFRKMEEKYHDIASNRRSKDTT